MKLEKEIGELVGLSKVLYNPYIKAWKEQDREVVGYFCTYVPEEIMYAAGILPIRIRATGSTETTFGDTYLSQYNCTFTRHCLDLALTGSYSFLDGLVGVNSCDHARRTFDIWKAKVKMPFFHFLTLNHKVTNEAIDWYKDEIISFKESIERQFQVEITDESLQNAIKIYNETRRLLHRLYDLRRREFPPITGEETLGILVAATSMPKDQFNQLLGELLEKISNREGISGYKVRLMLVGDILDDPDFVKIIEGLGGLVVIDNSCFGARYFWDLVDEDTNPIGALAKRYVSRVPSCPRMFGEYPKRLSFVKDRVKEFKVDGVVGQRLKWCDYWGGENYLLSKRLKESGIPTLKLEREYLLSGVGQLKTRVQTFLEVLEKEVVRGEG